MKLRPLAASRVHIAYPDSTPDANDMGAAPCNGEWRQGVKVSLNPDRVNCGKCKDWLRRHVGYYNNLIAKARTA